MSSRISRSKSPPLALSNTVGNELLLNAGDLKFKIFRDSEDESQTWIDFTINGCLTGDNSVGTIAAALEVIQRSIAPSMRRGGRR